MHLKQERKCISCRNCFNQNQLIRIAKIDNEFKLDIKHKEGGRGAYICNNKDCIVQVIKKRLLNRAFKQNMDDSIYEILGAYEQNN